ncbi:hypothetical protein BDV26DRAFT_276224 [Aspergillus bertholletiae]|uniref:Uncharacterized protein n=1 Tax=Aspergillus bertholletiae TaxID=1226010 RepID=A0A5N7ANE6_9EURO|nr:hypothetical protein BDV26DRAFT_276224 [Aspergillus bertholletiae]
MIISPHSKQYPRERRPNRANSQSTIDTDSAGIIMLILLCTYLHTHYGISSMSSVSLSRVSEDKTERETFTA